MSYKKVSFRGLNEIRAIAALAVLFHHLELFKKREKLASLYDLTICNNFIENLGRNGVLLFFALSGFLITYLLLVEKQQTKMIDIKAFYIRRILRIWPLYFVVVIIGFGLMPLLSKLSFFSNQTYIPHLTQNITFFSILLFLVFLSNFALNYFKIQISGASQSWSVSVEEQFYAIWPWVVKLINNTKVLFFVLLGFASLKIALQSFILKRTDIAQLIMTIPIEYMCIGGLFAIVLFAEKIPKIVFNASKWILPISIVITLFIIFKYNKSIVPAFLFSVIILLVAKSKLKNKILFYLGSISYGIYMYHPFCMFICFSLAKYLTVEPIWFNVLFYGLSVVSTIVISHFSYHYIESKFLTLKYKYEKIQSGA